MSLNQDRPLPPLPGIALLTWFGTIACLDRNQNRLAHVDLGALDSWHVPLGLRPEPGAGAALYAGDQRLGELLPALPPIIAGGGFHPNCITFSGGGVFMIALPDGLLNLASPRAKEWETFMPILAHDVAALHRLARGYWSVNGEPPVRTGFGEFRLKFGAHIVSLADNLPIDFLADAEGFKLSAAGAELHLQQVSEHAFAKQVWIQPLGNIGNRALQYLTAQGIARRVPGSQVRNVFLDMWGIHEPAPRPADDRAASTGDRFHLDIEGLAECLRQGDAEAICIDWYAFHLDHFPPREECRRLFPPTVGKEQTQGFGRHELVCSVRGAEILNSIHNDYFPLPLGYYAKLQEESGLDLVFHGQIGDDPYSRALREAFPKARFVSGVDQSHDFEVLRRSANIAISISTFSWLAAWLGEAERIYMPIGGIFSPIQHPDYVFIPLDDSAYRFMLLPPVKAVNLYKDPPRFWLMQDIIAGQVRPADKEELRAMIDRGRKLGEGASPVKGFDSAWYLANDPGAMADVRMGKGTALGHYLSVGYKHGAKHRPFDALFYAAMYPDAAEAVALGHYPDLWTHFMTAGEALGYAPVP